MCSVLWILGEFGGIEGDISLEFFKERFRGQENKRPHKKTKAPPILLLCSMMIMIRSPLGLVANYHTE